MVNEFKPWPDRDIPMPTIRQYANNEISTEDFDWLCWVDDKEDKMAGFKTEDETYSFEATVEARTAKAVLVDPIVGEKFWLPKSQIVDEHKLENDNVWFTVTAWIARKNGLI